MTTRRRFLQDSTIITAAGLFAPKSLFPNMKLLNTIGIQFFSLPKMLENDFAGALTMLSHMGYKEVELYGPYPFSTPAAKESWDKVTPSLGFKGSGFFGHTAEEVKALLKQNGLLAPSMHTDLDTLQTRMDRIGEASRILGYEYAVLPAIPQEKRKTLDDYKKMADAFNKIGKSAKDQGIKFGYHNHGYGLSEMEGQIPLKIILDNTDPSLVFFEMDIFWTTAGGADPAEYLKNYPNRYRMMHIKDMSKKARFSGDGGDPKQWIALFPYMTTAGNGVLDIKSIISQGIKSGIEHFFVEQDMVANPQVALKRSYDYLASL
jgi:sugar phosphate isomerase/epimerase